MRTSMFEDVVKTCKDWMFALFFLRFLLIQPNKNVKVQ